MSGRSLAPLVAAASTYLRAGWPVCPGAWWSPQLRRYQCHRPRCGTCGPHPVDVRTGDGRCQSTAAESVVTVAEVEKWWGRRSFALLLPTGSVLSVIEGPTETIEALDAALRAAGHSAPISLRPGSRAELFCEVLQPSQEFWLAAAQSRVIIHGANSWVTLPPSLTRTGDVRWGRAPHDHRWQLPPAAAVTTALDGVLQLEASVV